MYSEHCSYRNVAAGMTVLFLQLRPIYIEFGEKKNQFCGSPYAPHSSRIRRIGMQSQASSSSTSGMKTNGHRCSTGWPKSTGGRSGRRILRSAVDTTKYLLLLCARYSKSMGTSARVRDRRVHHVRRPSARFGVARLPDTGDGPVHASWSTCTPTCMKNVRWPRTWTSSSYTGSDGCGGSGTDHNAAGDRVLRVQMLGSVYGCRRHGPARLPSTTI